MSVGRLRTGGWLSPGGAMLGLVAFVLLAAGATGRAAAADAAALRQSFEAASLRTERSRTFVEADGSMRTVLYSAPVHYRDGRGNWREIKSRLVEAGRAGYAWANEEGGFRAELKAQSGEGVVRFEAGEAAFSLSLLDAASRAGARQQGEAVRYRDVLSEVDLEYALLPTGLKETLVLRGPRAPAAFVFRLTPTAGKGFELVERADGGLDVRTAASAVPVAVISAPVVNESKRVTVDDRQGRRQVLVDELAAAGKASMEASREEDGSYLVTLRVDERWLQAPERVFPVKLDPTVTTAVDPQDGYWYLDCSAGPCTPDTASNALVVSKDGTGTSQNGNGSFSNGTLRNASGILFSMGDVPAGATVTSARLDAYHTGCYVGAGVGSCGFWPPEDGEGQSGDVNVQRFSGAWGPATPAGSLSIASTVLATRSFSMWWGADQPGSWKSWQGSGLTSWVQDVVNGAVPNYGLALQLEPQFFGWGPIFASAEYSDPNLAPKLEIQWVADGVQLNPSTNIHSDGPELTWSRFAAGYGPYATTVLSDGPRGYWRLDDAAGSQFGIADWSGNNLHGTPAGTTHSQAGATSDGDTSIYFNGSSAWVDAPEATIEDTFTLEAWIKLASLSGGDRTIFSRGESNGGGFNLRINSGNRLELIEDSNPAIVASTTTIADTAWHHVAATKSGTNVKLYIDGQDVTGTIGNRTLSDGIGLVTIGAQVAVDGMGGLQHGNFFNGWIDEAAVYSYVLSEARIDARIEARDDVGSGFIRFEVHRSQTPGFTPSASTLIATLKDPVTQYYRDTTAKASTSFYYRVVTVGTGGSATSNQLAVTTPAAGFATITVQPGVSLLGADATTIAGGSACANNGGAGGITVSSSQRALLRFDLRQIPTGSDVSNAELSLWTFQNGGGQTIELQRLTADWVEGTGSGGCDGSGATWSDRQPNVPWASAGGEFQGGAVTSFASSGATPHWETTTITALVDDWVTAGKPNFGLLLKHASEAGAGPVSWTSDEYTGSPALRPKLVVTYGDDSDPKEPTVSIGAPGEGALVSGNVTVTAAAGDDSKVTQVEFLRGTTVFATDTSAPWQATLDSAALPNGSLELRARATDDVGHVTTSTPITVTVGNSAAPTTSVTGASGSATLTVSASAADDVGVTKVEFYVDGDRFATDLAGPYQGTLDTLAFPVYDGAHTLTSRAYDAHGNVTTSVGYPITVVNTAGSKYQATLSPTQTPAFAAEIPVGAVVAYAGSTAALPSGWALADGAAVSRTSYADLFAVMGTAFGAGNGSSTFNLPDLRGRFPLGQSGSGTGSTRGATGGQLDMQPSAVNLPALSLGFPVPAVTRSVPSTTVSVPSASITVNAPAHTHAITFNYMQSQTGSTNSFAGDYGSGVDRSGAASATSATTSGGGGGYASNSFSDTASTGAANAPFLALNTALYTSSGSTLDPGVVAPYTGASAPAGWLIADGSCYETATYPDLFAAIGYTHGGSGASFCLPDLRGRIQLGKASSGTGSTLGASGGSLDIVPSASFGNFTPSFSWSPAPFTFAFPDHTHGWGISGNTYAWDATGAASEYWAAGNLVPVQSYTSGAGGGQTVSTNSPAAQTINGTPAGAATATFAAENPAFQVVNYVIASGAASSEAFIASEVRYDPSAGTQEPNRTTIAVSNTSASNWPASEVFLRYRWVAPDGTITSSSNVSLGTDLAAGASRSISVDFDPPTLPTGVERSLYTLRFDLLDTGSGGGYFAAKGNTPFERKVLVTRVTPLELGLERYQQYEPLALGGGLTASANLATGNLVVSGSLVDNPGRGLSTLVGLAYNSQEPGSFAPAGNGTSLGTGLARLGQRLDIHPNASDTALGRTTPWIGFADVDGSYHRFVGRTIAGGDVYYDEPAGVQLYLRATGSADPDRYWALTRPDRVSFYFDENGWPTRTEDADGNALVYTLTSIAAGEDAYGLGKRVTKITDAGGREVTLAYYTKAETATPARRGKLKQITDHSGLVTRLDYYEDGNLLRLTQQGGVGDDGGYSPPRSLTFTYTNPAGTGPAIATLAGRRNPDPATGQGRLLYSLIDYRGNESTFSYSTSGATAGRLSAWTDRAGKTTSFSYDTGTATTTVARPLSRTSSYQFDASGRVGEISNPLGLVTAVTWASDNAVAALENLTTGRSTSYAYNANGYLTSQTNEKGDQTVLTYENLAVDADDASGNWPAGRSIPHLSQLDTRTLPAGVATPGIPNDYQWSFDYTASGNLQSVTDPLGNTTTHTYNGNGTLATTTLPANGDGITRVTSYESYDASGLPTQVKDAAGNRAKAAYGADGRPLWVQDPLHYADAGADTRSYRQVFDYDGYGRLIRTSSPKSSTWARGLLVWAESGYDANDNVASQVAPYYALDAGGYGSQTTSSYDAMDRVTSLIGPDSSSGGPEETQTVYDDAGRPIKLIAPKGVRTSASDDYTLITGYDLLDRPVSVTRYQLDGSGQVDVSKTRTSVYCYDAAGDLRSVTGPKGAAGFSCPSATAWPYTPTGQAYTTLYGYDAAHRQTSVTDPLGRVTQTAYDANGWVTKVTDNLGRETMSEYDQRGQATKLVQPFETGRTLTSITDYDALGNVEREISPRAYDTNPGGPYSQYVTSYAYDALGRPVRTALPKASTETQTYTHNGYDANGRLVWTSLPGDKPDPGGVVAADKTVNEYWDTGGLYSTTVAGSAKVRYDYTAEGWQAWRLPETAEGTGVADYARMMFWDYYRDGLLASERDLAGRRSAYGYDANGNRTSAAEAQSIAGEALTVASSFDGFDQLESVKTSKLGSSDVWKTTFAYDLHGNVSQLDENRLETAGGSQVSAPRVFSYAYDAADQPTQQTDDFGTAGIDTDDERFSFSFDGLGRLQTRTVAKRTGVSTYATTQTQERTYFFNGLLKTLVARDGAAATVASHALSYLQNGVYLNGNKTLDVFRLANPDAGAPCRSVECTASWEYDGRERLIKEVAGTGTTSEFRLDAAGNVTEEKRNGATYRTASYTGQRLTTSTQAGSSLRYLYDAQGNVDCVVLASWAASTCPAAATGQAVAGELVSDNVYDYRDRLVAVRAYASGSAGDRSEYRYDPLARPIRKTATESGATTVTDMVYLGVSDAVVRETETGASTKQRSYAFDALGERAGLSETVSGATSRYSYVHDPLGSVELLLDQANTVTAAYGYLPYGEANAQLTKTASGFEPNSNLYRYTGKRFDPAARAYDMGARHYFPGAGRWFQQDVYTDALANLALSSDPLTQNRYAFTAANPINYVEVDGHRVELPPGQQNVRSAVGEMRRDFNACLAGHEPSCKRGQDYLGAPIPDPVAAVACAAVPACAALWLADDIAHGRAVDAAIGIIPGGRLAKTVKTLIKKGKAAKAEVRWVDEAAAMSDDAATYQAGAFGARSNALTRARQAPELNGVRFDGFDERAGVLIDRKLSVTTFRKSQQQALRQSEALAAGGYRGRWEVPTAAEAVRATRMFRRLGISNIDVAVVPR